MSFAATTSPPSVEVKENIPQFWWSLSDVDKYRYTCLKISIASKSIKSQRNKRVETFSEILNEIKSFVIQGADSNNVIRGLVCGICWLPEGIAINTHQLRFLISKCKSSINGSLQRMGFSSSLGRTETATALSNACPIFKDNSNALRKWTIRKRGKSNSIPIISPFSFKFNPKPNNSVFSIPLTGIAKSQSSVKKENQSNTPESPPSSINTSPYNGNSTGFQCKVYTLPNIAQPKNDEEIFTPIPDLNFSFQPLDIQASDDNKLIDSFQTEDNDDVVKNDVVSDSNSNQISFMNDFGLMFNDDRIF